MKPAVVAFSARIASGKSTISTKTAELLGWPHSGFGDYLRKRASHSGIEVTRERLQDLGQELVRNDLETFCRNVLAAAGWQPGRPVILDGIRHLKALDVLKTLVAPLPVFLVYVDASEETRERRAADRGVAPVELHEQEQHPTEKDVAEGLPAVADLHVDGTMPVDRVADQLVTWLSVRLK